MSIDLRIDKKVFNDTYFPYLFKYDPSIEVYYGGAGSGKSVFVTQKLILKALKKKRKILVLRKYQAEQKESCWRLTIDILSQWKILQYCTVKVSDFKIEFPNGSEFLFKGLDNREKIKSIVGITDIWCEECTEFTEEDYEQLILRLRTVNDLQLFVSFNPISKANWVYKKWFAEKPPDDVFILKTTYKDNRFLPKKYIDNLQKLMKTNPTYYKIYVLGEFCSLDKLIYNNWEEKEFDYKELKGILCIGLDFGFVADVSALIASILDPENKIIYIFREWAETGKTNPEIANVIKELGFSKSTIIADSAEPKSIEEIRRLGIQRIKASVKGPDSIIHGIQKIQQYKIIVHPSCIETITELQNYPWLKDKNTGEYTNTPIDCFNHLLDGLRYSLQCATKGVKVMDIKKFNI